jgi:heptosyltransferase-3
MVLARKKLSPNIKSILLIQLGDIGDVVLSLPAIRALKEHFEQSRLVVCVREKARELLEDAPEVDGIIAVDKKKRPLFREIGYQIDFLRLIRKSRFDLAIDLRTGSRGTVIAILSGAKNRIGRLDDGPQTWRRFFFTHLVKPDPSLELEQYASEHHLNILASFGVKSANPIPKLNVSMEKRKRVLEILKNEGVPPEMKMVTLHPFSLWSYKEWRKEGWIRLIEDLIERRTISVLVTGSPSDRDRASEIIRPFKTGVFSLAGKTSIGEMSAILELSSLFIGVDSGIMHLAGAVRTPSIALFGPSSPVTWAPRNSRHKTVAVEMPCRPCRQKGCQGSEISRCLDELSYEYVKKAVDEELKAKAS